MDVLNDPLNRSAPSPGSVEMLGGGGVKRIAAAKRAYAAWEREHPDGVDPESFGRDVFPVIAGMSIGYLARTTGLSRQYCAAILTGERIPHPRWWAILRALRAS